MRINKPLIYTATGGFVLASLLYRAAVFAAGPDYLGNAQIMTSLADTQVGDKGNVTYANSVVFPFSKNLVSVRKYFVFVPGNAGGQGYYHGGDGGSIEFSLQTDDGTSAHNPSGHKLARTPNIIGGPPEPNGRGGLYDADRPPSGAPDAIYGCDKTDDANFREVCFDRPVAITAGQIYHLVAENTGSDPENSFVSMDDIYTRNGTKDRNVHAPMYDDLDFRVSYKYNGNWIHREEFVAIVEYVFDDGTSWGNGYMEVSPTPNSPSERASKWLRPQQDILQTFTPATPFTATGLHVGAMHYNGANRITASIVDSSGNVLWSGPIEGYPTGDLEGQPERWSGFEAIKVSRFRGTAFARPLQLQANQTYQIILRSTGGSHVIPAARDGAVSNRYFSQSTTVNGEAWYGDADAGEWTVWELGWRPPYSTAGHFDIAFYLQKQRAEAPPTLSIADARVDEPAGQADVEITLSRPTDRIVSVLVHTRVGSARGGSDYFGWTQTVTLQPGEMRKSVAVTLLNDAIKEPLENFSVHLLSPANATLDDKSGIVTIVDDDG